MRHFTWAIFFFAILASSDQAFAQTLNEQLSAEDPAKLAQQAREDGNIVRGAILFHQGNINCAKCHNSAEEDRIGPDLSRMEKDVTDEHLIESILNPSKVIKEGFESFVIETEDGRTVNGIKVSEEDNKIVIRDREDVNKLITIDRENIEQMRVGKNSSMPNDLANELKNRQQFLDLLRYVIDVKERGPKANANVTRNAVRRKLTTELGGLVLIQKLNCVSCHESESLASPVAAKQAPRLAWSAQTLNPEYIESFIANPHTVKPGTTMPELFGQLNDAAKAKNAKAIAHYLLSKSENKFQPQPIDGEAKHRGFPLFHSVGCVACHSPRNEQAEEQWIDDSTPLGDLSKKYNIAGLTKFLKDPQAVRPSGHMPNMRLAHREAVEISNYLLQSAPQKPVQWELDQELARIGQTLFKQQNCASCHSQFAGDAPAVAAEAKPAKLEDLNPEKGCLSEAAGPWPNFHLSANDRAAIQAALKKPATKLNDKQKIEFTLTAFNCIACHGRNDFGGIAQERNPHFKTLDLNLGDQGRIPPSLTGVGAKIKPKWMRDVMVNGRSIRPYMKTRMPQFGEENIKHLFELFESNDELDAKTEFAKFEDQKETRKQGHVLAGNKGLNCVACHTYQFKTSDTMPAVDLTEMTDRLKKDWFYQYMLAPQTFSPNTVMPSFWPGGKAIRSDLAGTPEEQIEALWQYLIDGRQARAPAGVVREPLEIVVDKEARMLRRSYNGIGKRGIGVGYPGGVNIAFDAEQMRVGSLWKGKFVEAGGVWRGQGHGKVRELNKPVKFESGPELDDGNDPWVVDNNRPPKHQFKGYSLDKQQRPTFEYQFDTVSVQDFFTEFKGDGDGDKTNLRRTVTMTSVDGQGELAYRVATAEKITKAGDVFVITPNLSIRITSDHEAKIVDKNNTMRLMVPLALEPNKQQQLKIEYLWK